MSLDPHHLLILTGPSGVGKDTIVERLKERGLPLSFVLTTTSRPERKGDRHTYRHVDAATFQRMITDGAFVEWAQVYGNYYGTEYAELDRAAREKSVTILENDIQGAKTIKQKYPDVTMLFIAPASLDELEQRLRDRGKNTEGEIRTRLTTADQELHEQEHADHVVVNKQDQLEQAVDEVEKIIRHLLS